MVVELDLGEYKSLMMLGNLQNSVGCASECLYVHSDHLGTPQLLTDQSQAVVWSADYEPFGEVNITTQTIENNLRFPGQYFDAETNLHYNYFRDYDPSLGRYVQSDPLGIFGIIDEFGIAIFKSMDANLYLYVLANPINYIDLDGERYYRTPGYNRDLHEVLENLDDPRPYWRDPKKRKRKLKCSCPVDPNLFRPKPKPDNSCKVNPPPPIKSRMCPCQ